MLLAIPSPACWNSLNVRRPRTIRSLMISSDHRSPNVSSAMLTGQPERRFFCLPGTAVHYQDYLQIASSFWSGVDGQPCFDILRGMGPKLIASVFIVAQLLSAKQQELTPVPSGPLRVSGNQI